MTNFFDIKIDSGKLKLIALRDSEVDSIYKFNTGNVRDYFIPFENTQEVKDWIQENYYLMQNGDKIELVILNDTKEFLGMISIRNIKLKPEFGLWIKEGAQGKGVGKHAASILIDWVKDNLNLSELYYLANPNNLASNALADSLGFKFIGMVMEDEVEMKEYMLKF